MGPQLLAAILLFLSVFTGNGTSFLSKPLGTGLINFKGIANLLTRGIIVFEDNFNGDSLDTTKWEYDTGCTGLHCYIAGSNNIKVTNGSLQITAKVENNNGKNFTSASIRQRGDGYQNGVFVARMKLAKGSQLFPSFRLLEVDTNNQCKYEEIDILGAKGDNVTQIYVSAAYGRNPTASVQASGNRNFEQFDFSKEFHEFSLVWTTQEMTWYVDSYKILSVTLNPLFWEGEGPDKIPCGAAIYPFDETLQAIFSLDVGGSFFGKAPPVTPEEAQKNWAHPALFVDWFKVYQLPSQITGTTAG